jgi:Zn-finger nucleic acid-binding protein
MGRHNYGYNSGIVIDGCIGRHGIWLDKDELDRIQVFIERWEKVEAGTAQKYQHILHRVGTDTAASFEQSQAEGRARGRDASMFGAFVGKIIK